MDLFALSATLQLDKSEYEKGLNDSESLASKAGSKIGSAFTTTAKAVGVGLLAAGTATAALVKSSVSAYAEFEQLVGGVETLFKNSADVVMQYADNAYKTAGLSANEYMETVTSFSASLLQSLGGDTQAAAEYADKAITDMADNANKMGTSMEMIQNAYQGFAKQNYTMLDNLKLGYGGTKEEMQRLLEDAEKISGIKYDISSYADVVEAIHVMQEEMGIAGTTAKEASTTIQGSLAMVKSAWENLVTGITDPNADIGQLIDNMVESAKTAFTNLVPAISQALKGVGKLVQEIAPVITKELPSLVSTLLPILIDTAITLLNGLIEALPDIIQVLFDQLPTILQAVIDAVLKLLPMIIDLGFTFIETLAEGLLQALPEILPKITQLILDLVAMFSDPANLESFIDAAVQIIMAIANGLIEALPVLIPAVIDVILTIVEKLTEPDMLIMLIEAAIEIMLAIMQGLIQAIPRVIEAVVTLIGNIVTTLIMAIPTISEGAWEMFGGLLKGLLKAIPELLAQIPILILSLINALAKGTAQMLKMGVKWVTNLKDGIKSLDPIQWGKDLIQNFIDGLKAKWEDLKKTCSDIAGSIKDFLGFSEPKLGPLSNFHTYAPDMMDLFMQGINDNKNKLLDTVQDAFDFQSLITAPIAGFNNDNVVYNNGMVYNGDSDIYSMLATIVEALPQLANSQIVLDTGILVGQTAPKMNTALGQIYSKEQRSV